MREIFVIFCVAVLFGNLQIISSEEVKLVEKDLEVNNSNNENVKSDLAVLESKDISENDKESDNTKLLDIEKNINNEVDNSEGSVKRVPRTVIIGRPIVYPAPIFYPRPYYGGFYGGGFGGFYGRRRFFGRRRFGFYG